MNIDYRQLRIFECERINEIDASTFVKRAWRKVESVKQGVEINWQDDDFPDGYANHLVALRKTFENGGFAIGAFDGERLVGFCSVNLDEFGKQYKYVLLDQIFISKEYKRKGIGRKLFYMSADKARKHGADKFYICAGSSEDTLAFYASLGCKDAEEINQVLYESDPNDVQLEYDLSNTQTCAEIKTERLFLRTLTNADAEILKNFSEEFENVEDALEWIRGVNTKKDMNDICFMFYIWLKQTNQLIGRVYFHSKYELDGEVEIGYGINEEHRNKGYATEAAKAVVRFAFEQAGQGELAAIVKRENIASRHVIEKLGFTYRGVRKVFDEGKNCEFDYFKLFPMRYRMVQVFDMPGLKEINALFSEYKNNIPIFQSILDGNYEGSIYVDSETEPTWAVLQTPIGLHFVAGKPIEKELLEDILFNRILYAQDEKQLIVFSPSDEWQPLLESIFKPRKGFVVPRKMFKFCHEKYRLALDTQLKTPENAEIITIKEHIDDHFCKNDEWVSKLIINGECVSVCSAFMVGGGYAEMDVKTHLEFQGRGYATMTTLALIQKLLDDSLIPCWTAWPYREASQSLAEKVGFIPEPDVNAWLWDENECS